MRKMKVLVLRRIAGQSIVIGENAEITIKILQDKNGVISVGIDAPKNILVNRLEVHEKRQKDDIHLLDRF